jgi:hypothetical protein
MRTASNIHATSRKSALTVQCTSSCYLATIPRVYPQSNVQINLRAPRVSLALLFIGGGHIGVRALHVLNLRYGLATSAYPSREERRVISSFKFKCFYQLSLRVEEGGKGHPVCVSHMCMDVHTCS